jgi:hypothetical protein
MTVVTIALIVTLALIAALSLYATRIVSIMLRAWFSL